MTDGASDSENHRLEAGATQGGAAVEPADGRPRWARELPEETWDKLLEMLYAGWDVPDIMRTLELPERKRRSLQLYAAKFSPRRRLHLFGKFKDALLGGAPVLGKEFTKALALVAQSAVSPGVKESTQQRAVLLMIEFTKALRRMMQDDQVKEAERERVEAGGPKTVDAAQVVADLKAIYGIR